MCTTELLIIEMSSKYGVGKNPYLSEFNLAYDAISTAGLVTDAVLLFHLQCLNFMLSFSEFLTEMYQDTIPTPPANLAVFAMKSESSKIMWLL